jgi:hypothetical protein
MLRFRPSRFRETLEEQPPPREQFLPSQRGPVGPGEGDAQQPAQPGTDVRSLTGIGDEAVKTGGQLAGGQFGRVLFGDAQPLPDDLGQRPERDALAVGQAPAAVPPDLGRQAIDVLLELPAQPGLPDPGRPGDEDQPRHPPVRRGVEEFLDRAQLSIPPSWAAPRLTATSPVTTPARTVKPATPTSAPSACTAATRSRAPRTARSASPSAAVGVPQTAITASPMNFSTTPP